MQVYGLDATKFVKTKKLNAGKRHLNSPRFHNSHLCWKQLSVL